jgi:hypothetical protein
MKKFFLTTALASLASLSSFATIYMTGWTNGVNATFANTGVVPDNSYSGWTDTRTLGATPAGTIQSLAVDLTLTGGWNGDLYAYLVNDTSGFSVLLDQIGTGPSGNGNAGMTVTLSTHATLFNPNQGSIAAYNGLPTGTWTPDITAGSWASLLGNTANGSTWTLFIADLSGGGVTTVQNWGLQMDIVAVPEVESWVAAALAGMFGAFWLNRQIWGPRKSV